MAGSWWLIWLWGQVILCKRAQNLPLPRAWNHKIVEWFGWERILKGHLIHLLPFAGAPSTILGYSQPPPTVDTFRDPGSGTASPNHQCLSWSYFLHQTPNPSSPGPQKAFLGSRERHPSLKQGIPMEGQRGRSQLTGAS